MNVSVGRVLLCALLAYTAYDQGPMTGVTAGLGLGLTRSLCRNQAAVHRRLRRGGVCAPRNADGEAWLRLPSFPEQQRPC